MPRNLSAEITADAGDYVSTVELAADRTDNLGDQASQASERVERLGDKSNTTATSVGAFGATISTTSAATSGLALATSASLVPALATLSATAVPLTATLGGLATAASGVAAGFGAVVGTGMYAYGNQVAESTEGVETAMGGLRHELKPVREQLDETAMSLGSEFTPLIEDAIDALPAFIRKIEAAVGDLTPFANALRDAGQAAFDVVPKMVAQMMDMGRDALPAVRNLGGYLANNAVPIMEGMADTTARVVKVVPDLAGAATSAVPKINQFGLTVLETVIPALETAGSKISDVAGKFNTLSDKQKSTAAKASLVAPALGTVATRLTAINPVLGGVTAAVGGLGFAWSENVGDIRGKTNDLVADMTKYESVRGALSSTASTAQSALGDATEALTTFVDENNTVQSSIGDLQSSLTSASEGITSLASGKWSSGFDSLVSAADSGFESIETTLVGSGGSGGLVGVADTAVTDAQTWLQNGGKTAFNEGMDAAVAGVVDSAQSLSDILVGPNGKTGALTAMVDQASVFLSQTAPKLLGASAEAVGSAIRGGLISFTNPLRGKDSELWDMLTDSVKWLAFNVPQLFISVGQAILKGIYNGVKGLYKGLVGNSVLKDQIDNAGTWLVNNMGSLIGGVGGAIKSTILSGLSGLKSSLVSSVKGAINAAKDVAEGAENRLYESSNDYDDSTGLRDAYTPDTPGDCRDGFYYDSSMNICRPEPGNDGNDTANTPENQQDDEFRNPSTGDRQQEGDSIDTGPDVPDRSGDYGASVPTHAPSFIDRPVEWRAWQMAGGDRGEAQRILMDLESAATGGHIAEGGLLNVHEGERVVPASQVTDRGEVTVDMDAVVDELRAVRQTMEREFDISVEIRDTDRYQTVRR